MKGKFGNKKAGDLSRNCVMIVTILAVTVFIGTAIQPALSARIVSKDLQPVAVDEEYLPCDCEQTAIDDSLNCKTCMKAVFHAVQYTKEYVKNTVKDKGVYFLWTADVAIVIVKGLFLGLKDSGFKISIDLNELNETITYWVNTLWGPQMFFVTRFMAKLGAIYIGIAWYLLSFCVCTSKIIPF